MKKNVSITPLVDEKIDSNFLEILTKCSQKTILIWQETTPQHFPSPTGFFDANSRGIGCTNNINIEVQKKLRINGFKKIIQKYTKINLIDVFPGEKIVSVLENEKYVQPEKMYFLNYFNITKNRSDAHEKDGMDCTHFCTYPPLYEPLWDMITISIENALGLR